MKFPLYRSLISIILFPCIAAAQGPSTVPGTLFNDTSSRGLIGRRTACKKGDVLLIRVNEAMKGQYAASTTTSKSEAATANQVTAPIVDVFAGPVLSNILGSQAGLPSKIIKGLLGGASTGGTQTSTGTGSANSSNQFTASLSVVVTDVDSAGNLHIEGTRDVQINKETQKMVLTGIVRQDDVQPDNTVASERIANAQIKADGKGPVADKTRQSLLNKILNWLF